MLEKVIERMGTTESTTLAVSRKIRVGSLLWETPKVILRGEGLEVRNVDCPLRVAEARHHDD
jgi:hypothetical protein